MRILLANKYWYPRGGAEVVAMMTEKLLREAGHETAVFAMQHPQNEVASEFWPTEIDYRHDSLTKKIKNSYKTLHHTQAKAQFEKMVKHFQPDVVHFHNIYHQLSFSLLEVVKKYHLRSVMTLHDYKLLSPNYSLFHHGRIDTTILGKNFYRCMLNNCLESWPQSIIGTLEAYYRQFKKYHDYIDVYISPSRFLQQLFVQAGWGQRRIEVVRNPVMLTQSPQNAPAGNSVTYIGRLSPEKGLEVLFQAAELTPFIPYTLVGSGPAEYHLRSLCISKRIKNVTFAGWKTGKELETLFQQARLLVVPSIWYENAPLGILEAKARGKIVLASDIGGIPEILDQEFLFPPGNAQTLAKMITLWYGTLPAGRAEVGAKLRTQVATQNAPALYVKQLIRLYQK